MITIIKCNRETNKQCMQEIENMYSMTQVHLVYTKDHNHLSDNAPREAGAVIMGGPTQAGGAGKPTTDSTQGESS